MFLLFSGASPLKSVKKSQFYQAQNLLCGDHRCWLNSCCATCSWSLHVLWILADRCLQAASFPFLHGHRCAFKPRSAVTHAAPQCHLPTSPQRGAAHLRLAQDTCRDVLLRGGGSRFRIMGASSQQRGSQWMQGGPGELPAMVTDKQFLEQQGLDHELKTTRVGPPTPPSTSLPF